MLERSTRLEVEPALVRRVARVTHLHANELVGLPGVGRREEEFPGEAEHGDVAAGAERDRARGGEQQHRLAQQSAERVVQVAREVLDERDASGVARLLLHLLDAAERAQRGQARGVGRHSVGDVLLDLELDVRPELAIELIVDAPATREGTEAEADHVEPAERHWRARVRR